jgi:DNA-binding NarL/FixJ family response regulator/Tfp pilus assembly protein PilF
MPELRELFGEPSPQPAGDPEREKHQLFQALLQPIVRLARGAPLLLIVEDLHWGDDTSLEFLQSVARRTRDLPVVLLVTYRSDEVDRSLAHFLAELDRGRATVELSLHRLGRPEVARMIGAIFGATDPPLPDLVTTLHELTDGNPFFIEEVLKSLTMSGQVVYRDGAWGQELVGDLQIPRSVHDAVQQRSARLSDDAQRLLVHAAVAGRRFDLPLLAHVSGTSDAVMLASTKELIAAQLVVEESEDHFAFRHALTQQAIYSGLLIRERRTLHREIAEAIREGGPEEVEARLGELAHHYFEAGEWDEAFEYSARVGEMAQRLFSPAAAVRHFTRALAAVARTTRPQPAWVYSARGRAHDAVGDFEAAREDHETALRITRAELDLGGEWRALLDLGFLWATKDYERAGEFFRRALDLARVSGDRKMLGRSLNRLGNWLANVGRVADGLEEQRAALEIFTALGDRQGEAETLDLIAMALGQSGELAESVSHYGRTIALLRELGDEQRLMSALSSRTTYSSPGMADTVPGAMRALADVRKEGQEALDIAYRSGSGVAVAYAHWTLAATLGTFGRIGEGLALAKDGLRIATEIQHEQWMIGGYFTLGQIHWLTLNYDAAISQLEASLPLAHSLKSAWWIGNVGCYLALTYLTKGDRTRARQVLDATPFSDDDLMTLPGRRIAWARAELLIAEDRGGEALSAVDRLLSVGASATAPYKPPALLVTRARALLLLGKADEACEVLQQAAESARVQGDLPWSWRARCALARACGPAKREEAQAACDEARAIFATLLDSIDASDRDRFIAAAESELPQMRPPTARRAAKQEWEGLTERERDVAAQVTLGRSNREIAEALVLSERTVETHIGNVLRKLGFSSRAQIAAWGAQRGLSAD